SINPGPNTRITHHAQPAVRAIVKGHSRTLAQSRCTSPGRVAGSGGGGRGSRRFVDDLELDPVWVEEEGGVVVPLDVVRELLGSALRLHLLAQHPLPALVDCVT